MGGRVPAAARRRLAVLAAAGTAGLTAIVWWCSRGPGAGMAVSAPPSASPSSPPAERPFPPIDVARVQPFAAGPERRDPLLGAVSSDYGHAVVLEVNALVHSPLGRLWLGCVEERDREEAFDRLKRSGMDPLVDVDRAAVAWDTESRLLVAASGHFGRADPAALARSLLDGERQAPVRPHGSDAVVVDGEFCFLGCSPAALAVWRDRTLILSDRGAPEPRSSCCRGGPTAGRSPSRRASRRPRCSGWSARETWPNGSSSAILP